MATARARPTGRRAIPNPLDPRRGMPTQPDPPPQQAPAATPSRDRPAPRARQTPAPAPTPRERPRADQAQTAQTQNAQTQALQNQQIRSEFPTPSRETPYGTQTGEYRDLPSGDVGARFGKDPGSYDFAFPGVPDDPNVLADLAGKLAATFAANPGITEIPLLDAEAYGLTPEEALMAARMLGRTDSITPEAIQAIQDANLSALDAASGALSPAPAGPAQAPYDPTAELQPIMDQYQVETAALQQNIDDLRGELDIALQNQSAQPDIMQFLPYMFAGMGGSREDEENKSIYYYG